MSGYFSRFPSIAYGNTLATNILARIKINSLVRDKKLVFHPYTLKEGERPDTIAEHYYGDPYFAWLVYFANEVIDPYYEWPLSQRDFEQYIRTKYGTTELAQEKIVYYQNNWSTDESMLTPGAFDSLPAAIKKYWTPVIGFRNTIISYERKQSDLTIETNKIIELTVADGTGFALEEQVKQTSGGSVVASGFVKYTSATSVVIEKVTGTFSTSYSLVNYDGDESTSVSAVTTIKQSLSDDESIYWSPVTAYEYEDQLNEQKKQIYLIDKSYLDQIELEMKSLLA
jgi:hypothetical protein